MPPRKLPQKRPRPEPPESKPKPKPEPPPSSSSPTPSAVTRPPSADPAATAPAPNPTIVASLPVADRDIYLLVWGAGNRGMWTGDVRAATSRPSIQVNKSLKSLVARRLLKEVSDVHRKAKKIYMAAEFEPSPEITGGTWYRDGAIDDLAIDTARRCCLKQIEKFSVATVEMIWNGIKRSDPMVEYSLTQVKDIVQNMVLNRQVEEVRSTGNGEFAAVPAGRVCYRKGRGPVFGTIKDVPCGVCPRILECTPDGVISPRTCVYYNKWLKLEF